MLRLSKRAWNNVLIISMLALILILNMDRFSSNDKPAIRPIVDEGEYILSLSINQVKIEKAASQWRINSSGVQPNQMPSAQTLQAIVSAWQQAYIQPAEIDFTTQIFGTPDTLVEINIAGRNNSIVVAFSIVEQQLFLVIDKQVFVLMSPSVGQLLSPIVLVKQ